MKKSKDKWFLLSQETNSILFILMFSPISLSTLTSKLRKKIQSLRYKKVFVSSLIYPDRIS